MTPTSTGRWLAAAATAGAAAHLAMVPGGGWMAVLGLAMAAACVPCAWHLWRRPSPRAAHALLGMSLTMVAVHAALLVAGSPAGTPGSAGHAGHAAGGVGAAAAVSADHAGAMLAVLAVELLTALAAAAWVRRERAARR